MNVPDFDQYMRKGHIRMGLKVLSTKDTKKFENWARNGRDIPMSVWDDLAAPSDLNLNQSPGKGHNQFGLEILSAKDTKSLKIGPETAEKSQGQFGTTSRRRVTSTSTNICVKGIIRLVSKF